MKTGNEMENKQAKRAQAAVQEHWTTRIPVRTSGTPVATRTQDPGSRGTYDNADAAQKDPSSASPGLAQRTCVPE